jgi:hypothetical protein
VVVIKRLAIAGAVIGLSLGGWAQTSSSPQLSVKLPVAQTAGNSAVGTKTAALTPGQKFVMDAVNMAVALPQSDPQDRLRVLASAASVASTTDPAVAQKLSREGLEIETELIAAGQKPVVSLMSSGRVDCNAAQQFVENLPPASVPEGEQSLIGAITSCPKQTLDPASRKLDAAMEKNVGAPRALMAAIEAQGATSPWTQDHFEKAFSSLPDPKESAAAAEDFAALYSSVAGAVKKPLASKAGLQLMSWLAKIDDSPLRSTAIRTAGGAMEQALGAEGYRQALATDAVANTLLHSTSNIQNMGQPQNLGVSVLAAMEDNGSDQSDRLRVLPASERAREAAAHGFASTKGGDKQQAGQYFDMAFAALDEAWDGRTAENDTAAVVQEVGEAAAQTGSLDALERAQKLRDSSAQAIAMLAVARVVASNGVIQ